MALTLTLTDMLVTAGIVVPLACSGIYMVVRMAIRSEVTQLELRITQAYMAKDTCRQIREECERHRAETTHHPEARRARA